MEEIKYEVMDDLKYKLRNKVDEKNAIVKSIVPMKEYAIQVGLSILVVGLFLFGVSFLILSTFGFSTFASALAVSGGIIGGGVLFIYPLALSSHRENIELKKKALSQKELEINELLNVIKELEKKNKIIDKQNDSLKEKEEKKVIREEDFLDYYLDITQEEEIEKPRQLIK